MIEIGIDIEEISRFQNKTLENDAAFLKRLFTEKELEYCFSGKNPAQHLAARFCAKEAAIKALSGIVNIPYKDIEVLNEKSGKPYLAINGCSFKTKISLSHTKTTACATVLVFD
jgi:holo-[acyl-carrier protein] synthase